MSPIRLKKMWRPAVAGLAVALAVAVTPLPVASAFAPTSKAALLTYLNGISGQNTIAGQHNREPNSDPTTYTRVAQSITGQTPGLWGGDFLFEGADVAARQTMVNEAILQWQGGSVVTLTWHFCPPTTGTSCHWESPGAPAIKDYHLSDAQWNELITNGSGLNNAFKRRLDEAVPYLRQLQSAGVPVIFRPVHEMNEGWSWWGGRPGANGSRKLYQIVHDYLVGTQGITSMVWSWNVKDTDMGSIGDYWPGASYVDMASLDIWVKKTPSASDYQAMLNVAGGKPIALGEVGTVPSAELLASQPRWTYFMVWAEWLTDPAYNNNAAVQASYFSSRVLVRGEFTVSGSAAQKTGKIRGLGGKCLDVAAAGTANGTKVQLYTCDANGSAQAWTVSADKSVRALGKCLDVAGAATADGTKVQLWDCNGSAAQQWTANVDGTIRALGKCLDAAGQSSADGTQIQNWSCTGQANQKWSLPA
jgi:mannan endo-1,4-beta-mannosidase